jgi:rhodanese-related sulfurtransferase
MRRLLLVLVVAMFGLVACSSSTQTSLSPQDFQELAGQPGVVTLDVRTPAEYASGHLPGAVNIDVESADFSSQLAQLDPAASYAVYCRSGNRSKVAMDQMAAAGFTTMQDLEGGIVAWQSQGLPVTTQ